jgi:flagellar FliL protein
LLLAVGLSVGAPGSSSAQASGGSAPAEADAQRQAGGDLRALAPAFVVNFNQNGRQRYMQVSITMQGRDQADLDALKVHMPVIRNNLVMMFSGQGFDTLATPVGRRCCARRPPPASRKWRRRNRPVVVDQCFSPISYCSRNAHGRAGPAVPG